MTNDRPLACSLGAADLAQRLTAIAEIGADSLVAEAAQWHAAVCCASGRARR